LRGAMSLIKLHLGCGSRYIPGFVHIDVVYHDHIDYLIPIDDLIIYEDNTVDLIYNCHALEHFHRKKVLKVLKEWHRVLKPNGVLRISVPDFSKLCEIYMETKDIDLIIGPIVGRQDYLYNIHYNIFDYASLEKVLKEVGFREIAKYDWRRTEHAHIDDYSQAYYPHMDKEHGRLISLNLEAIK